MMHATRLVEQRVRFDGAGDVPSDARRRWTERRSLLFVVEDDAGNRGVGEAAPLPDYSPDTLDDAWKELGRLLGRPLGELGGLHDSATSRVLGEATQKLASPAARFAFESAALDLWSRRLSEPAWRMLGRIVAEAEGRDFDAALGPSACPVAALLPSGVERALAAASQAFARDVRAFKLKIGAPGHRDDEQKALAELRQRFPEARLRADANQSLGPSELEAFLPALRSAKLEWLEEPVADFPNALEAPLGVPLALDESLVRGEPDPARAREHGVRAYVLKPTTLGGLVRSLELARSARALGFAAVVSHAYEGPLGFSALAALALTLGPGRPADGLDRHPGVADAGELPAFDPVHSRIRPWTEPGLGIPLDAELERREITREARA